MGYVYILRAENDYYKIGAARDLGTRIDALKTINIPFKIELVNHIRAVKHLDLERALHQIYSKKKFRGEWYKLNPIDLADISNLFKMDRESPYIIYFNRAGAPSPLEMKGNLVYLLRIMLLKNNRELSIEEANSHFDCLILGSGDWITPKFAPRCWCDFEFINDLNKIHVPYKYNINPKVRKLYFNY